MRSRGFSLLELMVSMAVLLIVAGAVFSGLIYYQKVYASEQLKADLHASFRGPVELLTQEIGQAGSLGNFPARTLGAAVVGSGTAQTVALSIAAGSPTAGIFVGELLLVDLGHNQEMVAVTAVSATSVSGIFQSNHLIGVPVVAVGIFPQGVLSSSTATSLQMFGDINADGTLVYVQYDCNAGTPAAPGTLSRSITPITAAAKDPSQVLVANLVANPGNTPCFQFTTAANAGYTFVTSIGVTLSIQTAETDPETGQYVTLTKSFLNLAPRNIADGLAVSLSVPQTGTAVRLQPTPPGLPLP